ncbi:MAG: hypothetical protein PUC50_03215 [Bacteroidales bacterium]|nr:hypothetical protein [Bacteroidales bacterium]
MAKKGKKELEEILEAQKEEKILEAQKFVTECKKKAAKNAKQFNEISTCVLIGMFIVGIIDMVFQSVPFIMLLMGIATMVFGFLPKLITHFGYLKRFKNNLIAKTLTEDLLVKYRHNEGDFANTDKEKALGTFATKFQEIKSNLDKVEIEILEDTNQLINK